MLYVGVESTVEFVIQPTFTSYCFSRKLGSYRQKVCIMICLLRQICTSKRRVYLGKIFNFGSKKFIELEIVVQFWKVVVTCRCQKLPIKKSCNAKVFWKVMNWVSKIGFSRTRNQPKNGILVRSKWLFFIFGMFHDYSKFCYAFFHL